MTTTKGYESGKGDGRPDELELEAAPVKDLDVEDVAAQQVPGGGTRTTKAPPPTEF